MLSFMSRYLQVSSVGSDIAAVMDTRTAQQAEDLDAIRLSRRTTP